MAQNSTLSHFKKFPGLLLGFLLASNLTAGAAPESHDFFLESVQPPKNLIAGQKGEVIVRVGNKGSGAVPSGKLMLIVDGKAAGEVKLSGPLEPLTKTDVALPLEALTAGKHRIRVEAQVAGVDVDPGNNSGEETLLVGEKVEVGDVHLATMEVRESDIPVGLPTNVSVTVENSGDRPVHRLQITLFEGQQKVLHKTFYTNLEGKSSKEYQLTWVPKQTGKVYLFAVVGPVTAPPDPKQSQPNTTFQLVNVLEVEGFKLDITNVELPPNAKVDQEMIADVVVRNSGEMDAKEVKVVMISDAGRMGSSRVDSIKAGQEGHFELRWTPRAAGTSKVRFVVEGVGRNAEHRRKPEKQAVVEVRP